MELLIFLLVLTASAKITLFKFQYGATNIVRYNTLQKYGYTFKFQYGATNIRVKFTL